MAGREEDWSALMRAANAGDGRAYARLLHDIAPVVRGIVRSRAAAFARDAQEDIVQDVLLAIHLKRQTWRPDCPVTPWVYAIARYKVIDALRARGARVHLPIEDFAEILPAEPAADPTERSDALKILAQLDPRSAGLLQAVGLDGVDATEAGRRLGLSEGAVRVALHRGLKRLAELRNRQTR
ncbi:MAG: sigma-70 family RNA polymerase sigma factor [Paracoccaceae bacterium]